MQMNFRGVKDKVWVIYRDKNLGEWITPGCCQGGRDIGGGDDGGGDAPLPLNTTLRSLILWSGECLLRALALSCDLIPLRWVRVNCHTRMTTSSLSSCNTSWNHKTRRWHQHLCNWYTFFHKKVFYLFYFSACQYNLFTCTDNY